MHDPELDAPLDAVLDGSLSRLAIVRAPETLLPRVMTATQRLAARPWYTRTWDMWPVPYQRMSVTVCLLVLAAMTWTMPLSDGTWIEPLVARAGGRLDAWLPALNHMARIAKDAEAVTNTAGSLWQRLFVPLVLYASVVGALLCLLMGLLAVTLNRLTPGKAFSR
jgi:hypothetical protein